jgi:hypothetical protein
VTPEGKVEAYLKLRVKQTGGRHRKLRWLSRRGAPDQFIWWPGPDIYFVEVKRLGKDATVQQAREHKRLRADGFKVFVIDSKEAVDAFITLATSQGG